MTGLKPFVIGGLMAIGFFAGPALANAPTQKVDTDVVHEGYDVFGSNVTFYGHVSCDKRKCVKRRLVTLDWRDGLDGPEKVGTDRTDSNGHWEITFNSGDFPPGNYRATASKRVLRKKRGGRLVKKTVCKRGSTAFCVANCA